MTTLFALVVQMRGLFLSQWRAHGHVCENYSPMHGAKECTGMLLYHWCAAPC